MASSTTKPAEPQWVYFYEIDGDVEITHELMQNRLSVADKAWRVDLKAKSMTRDKIETPREIQARLYSTTDASVWAAEFMKVGSETVLDEGAVIGWFANAIETAKSHTHEKIRAELVDDGPTTAVAEQPAANVLEAINRVKRDLPGINKQRDPESDVKYAFRGIEQLTAHLQNLTAKHGVVIMPVAVLEREDFEYQTSSNTTWHETRIRFRWGVYGPGGLDDVIYGETWGFGRDNQDKGASKAQTQGYKEFLIKLFCIGDKSTDGDSDVADEQAGRTFGSGQPPAGDSGEQSGKPSTGTDWHALGWVDKPTTNREEWDAAKAIHDQALQDVKEAFAQLPESTRSSLTVTRQNTLGKLPWSYAKAQTWAGMVNEALTAHLADVDEASQQMEAEFGAVEDQSQDPPDQAEVDAFAAGDPVDDPSGVSEHDKMGDD